MKKSILCSVCVICMLTSMRPAQIRSQTQQWPMSDGSRERINWARDENVLYPPLQMTGVYTVTGEEDGYYECLSWHDHLLGANVEADEGNFFAFFDTQSGSTLWTFGQTGYTSGYNFVPAQNSDLVLCSGDYGNEIHALFRQTGQQKWIIPLSKASYRNPILDGEVMYIVTDCLHCLNLSDGSARWSVPFTGQITPAVDDLYCYVSGGDREAAAFVKTNGTEKWRRYNSDRTFSITAVFGETVYTHSNDSILARDRTTGSVRWAYAIPDGRVPQLSQNSTAVSDNVLCFSVWENSDGLGQIYALNRSDGTYLWHHTFPGEGALSPVIANGVVYLIHFEARALYGFHLNTGSQVFYDDTRYYIDQPIVADHKLYAGSRGGIAVFENENTGIARETRTHPARSFRLLQNHPNPFNPVTVIPFSLTHPGHVRLEVFDPAGHRVAMPVDRELGAGDHRAVLDGRDLASGIYWYRLQTGCCSETKKMLHLK